MSTTEISAEAGRGPLEDIAMGPSLPIRIWAARARHRTVAVVALVLTTAASPAGAQSTPPMTDPGSWSTRARLLDAPDGPRDVLRKYGLSFDLSLTHFYQGQLRGQGSHNWQSGASINASLTVDTSQWWLWPGLSVTFRQDNNVGNDVNAVGIGILFPPNVSMAFPRAGGHDAETSVVVTQMLGLGTSLSIGKFNMLPLAARTPLVGGGGLETFMNTAIAAPISGVTPPFILGGILTHRTDFATFTVMVYDPRSAQSSAVLENPFSEGVTTSLSITVPVQLAGLHGYQNLRGVYSSKAGVNLDNIPDLFLPASAQPFLGTRRGYYFGQYSFQQNLVQYSDRPDDGWGVFGQFSLSDANPNPIAMSWFLGVGGRSFIEDRPLDRWGVAYFSYKLSAPVLDGLNTLDPGTYRNESGLEAYYNLAVTPWLRMSADIQWLRPFSSSQEAVVAAVRTQVRF